MKRCSECGRPLPGRPRTLTQNAFYWGALVEALADYSGYTKDEAHDVLREMFLREPPRDHKLPGRIRSTTELSTVEFSEYTEKVRVFLIVDLGLVIQEKTA